MMKPIDKFILFLFYIYIFALPFENILEVQWDLDTPYQPYRILGLFIGLLILLSRKFSDIKLYKNDLKLAGVYFFGLIPSLIAWLDNRLYFESFWSTSLQYFIVLWLLLLIKNLPLEFKQVYNCMNIYCVAVLINSLFMIYNFIYIDIGRQSGFMHNAHYAAFANNIAFAYFFYLFYHRSGVFNLHKIVLLIAALIALLGLLVAGSRTSLISMMVIVAIILLYNLNTVKTLVNLTLVCIPLLILFSFIDYRQFINVVPAWNRFITLLDKEDSRTVLWKQGMEAFKETHYLGLGIEQFKNPENYRRYVHKTDKVSVAVQEGLVLHNDYLAVLVEFGIISFILFISFYLGLLRKLREKVKQEPACFVFLLWFVIMAILSAFTNSFQSHSMWFVYIILGFASYLHVKSEPSESPILES